MSRYVRAVVDAPAEWVDVSADSPCPVCGATSGCSVLADGEFGRCLTTVCDWPVLTGGWLHRLTDQKVDELTTV